MGNRVLVTGGAGFLGAAICRRLIAEGHFVICMDDMSTGSIAAIADFAGHPHCQFIQADVADPIRLSVDWIFNLACPASPRHYQADPIKTMRTCVLGVMSVLELADRIGARLLQASTSEIYGNPDIHPQPEWYLGNVNPIGPRACYDEGKRAGEALCADYHRARGVDVRIARIFNTYGPGMSGGDGRVVQAFVDAALAGQTLQVFGSGSQTRSFCFVDDMVDALLIMMRQPNLGPIPINLGNDAEVSIASLAEQVISLAESSSAISYFQIAEDDPARRRPDLRRAREVLGWAPTVSLACGLQRMIDARRAVLRAAS